MNEFWYTVLSILYQLGCTIGLVAVFGIIVSVLNKNIYGMAGDSHRIFNIVTGCIGTPVHEMSHALMCIIFFHHIDEIALFTPSSTDGTLGYVNHSYNPRNIYQRVGNFFIGTAPIIVGFAILIWLLHLLLPELLTGVIDRFSQLDKTTGWHDLYLAHQQTLLSVFKAFASWQWWVYLFVGSFIALHMTLSPEDIKGSFTGLGIILLAAILVNSLGMVFNPVMVGRINLSVTIFASTLVSICIVFVIMMFILWFILFLIKLIFKW